MDSVFIFYAVALALTVSILLTIYFPVLYAKEKQSVIEQITEIETNNDVATSHPVLLAIILALPVLLLAYSEDIALSMYCFIFAMLAYADLSARWLPDALIYTMLTLAVYIVKDQPVTSMILSTLLFIAPAALLNISAFIKATSLPIARGDFYVFPSIGVTLSCEYAASVMVVAVLVALVISRKVKQVPFILVLYIAYFGYITCVALGFL